MKKGVFIILFLIAFESKGEPFYEEWTTGDSTERPFMGRLDYPTPEISGVNIMNRTNYNVEEMIKWFCIHLDLEDVFIRVSYLNDHHGFDGMVVRQHPKVYFIRIRKGIVNPGWVCLHELVHIKQYISGDLSVIDRSTVNYKGKEINLEWVDYKHRSYEQEARWETLSLWKQFKRYKKEKTS